MKRARFIPGSCPVREFTADGVPVGRCWYQLTGSVCPRHGDIDKLHDADASASNADTPPAPTQPVEEET